MSVELPGTESHHELHGPLFRPLLGGPRCGPAETRGRTDAQDRLDDWLQSRLLQRFGTVNGSTTGRLFDTPQPPGDHAGSSTIRSDPNAHRVLRSRRLAAARRRERRRGGGSRAGRARAAPRPPRPHQARRRARRGRGGREERAQDRDPAGRRPEVPAPDRQPREDSVPRPELRRPRGRRRPPEADLSEPVHALQHEPRGPRRTDRPAAVLGSARLRSRARGHHRAPRPARARGGRARARRRLRLLQRRVGPRLPAQDHAVDDGQELRRDRRVRALVRVCRRAAPRRRRARDPLAAERRGDAEREHERHAVPGRRDDRRS